MAELRYKSPRTGKVFVATPDDPTKEPDQEDYDWFAKRVEQLETGTEQSALGAMASSAAQGLTSIPGTVAQGVGALTGITGLEESGKYFADQARALTPIDPMRREDFSTKAAGAVGQAVGQLGAALATGGGSIGTGVVLGMAGAMGAASGAESAEARGLEGARRYGEVLGYGATEIVSERLFGLGSKSFFKPATDFQAKVLKTGKTIGGEAVEEAGAGLGTNIVSNLTALGTNIPTPDILSGEAFKGYAEQALLGAVGGTVFAGAQMAMGEQATQESITRKSAVIDGVFTNVTGVPDEVLIQRGAEDIKLHTFTSPIDAEAIDSAPDGAKVILESIYGNELEVPIGEPTPEQNKAFDEIIAADAAKKAAAAAAAGVPPTTPTEAAVLPTEATVPTEAAAEPPITPPAVEPTPTPTPTPTPDATQIREVSEGNIVKYPSGNEVGKAPETGDSNRPVEGGQVEPTVAQGQAVTPILPSGALPTETGTLPTTPMTGVSGGVAPDVTPTAAPIGENTLEAVINTPGQGPIATKAQTLLENVKRNIKAGIPPTASLTPDGNIVFPTPEAAPGVPQQARRTPLNSAVVKQSVQKVFGIVPKNVEFIDTDERVDGKAFVKDQRVQINLRYIQSKERLEEVLREESFHLIYQDPLVQADVDLLKQEIPDDIKAEIDQLYSDPRFTDSVRLEESVARLVERLSEKTAWQRFVGSVRAAFQKLFGRPPSPRELTLAANRILERAIANVAVQQTAEEVQGAEDAGDVRMSITPESQRIDQEYLAAVEAGDMETAQRLVKEAAKKAGYNVGPVYHGTPMGGFTAFDKKYQGQTGGISRGGFSFTTNKEGARTYAEANTEESVTLSEALRIANTSLTEVKDQEALEAFFIEKGYDGIPEYSWEAIEDPQEFANFLLDFSDELPPSAAAAFKDAANLIFNGYGFNPEVKEVFLKIGEDPLTFTATPKTLGKVVFGLDVRKTETKSAVVNLGGGEQIFYVAEPNQIKSAEPVTRDDAGNIILPSERFQKTSDDIRYSVTPTVQIFGEKVVATAIEVQSRRELMAAVKDKVFDYTQPESAEGDREWRDIMDRWRPTESGPPDLSNFKEIITEDAAPGAVTAALYIYANKKQDGGLALQELRDSIEFSKYFPKEGWIDFWTEAGIGGNVREAGRGLGILAYAVGGLNKAQNVSSNADVQTEAAAKGLDLPESDMRAIDISVNAVPNEDAVAKNFDDVKTGKDVSVIGAIKNSIPQGGAKDPTKNPDNSPATDPKSIEQISAQKLVKDATKKDKKPKDTTQTDAVTAIVQDHLEKKGGQLEADLTRKLTEAGMSPEAAKKLATNTEKKLERDAKKESEREAKAIEGAKELSDADRVAQRITKKLLSTKDEAAKRKIHPIVALVARYFKANGKLSEEQLENELAALGVSTEIGRELVDAATAELGKRQAIKAARDKARKDNAATRSAENFTKNWEKSQDPAQQTKEKTPDPVRAFLNESSKVLRNQIHFDLSPNGKALFFDTVYTRLINLNVSPEAAMAATSAAYQKYLTNRANKIAKLRDTVAKEGLSKALAKQILNLTRTQQRDPEFAKQFIEQTLIDAGVPQDIANASVPLLLPSFQKALADAREKALMDFINGRPPSAKRIPKEKLDDLRKAVRLGATNPDYQPSTPFAKANGWQNFTRAEHDEMARQDEIASDPLQTNQERQLALSKIAKIASKRMPKNSKLNLASEIYRNSALSNFLSTGGIQVWTPVFSAAVRSFTDGVRGLTQERNLNRFIASLEGFLRAASPTALKAELTSSFGQNITTYNKAYEIDDLSQLHALLLDGVETWKTTKSPLKKAKALISITYGSMDYVRRSYASLDNVSQSVFYRQIMDLGMRDIILSKGGSETDFKNLISNRTRRHEQLVTELISQGQSPSRAWVNASELSYREMNGDLVDIYGDDVAVEIQAKDEMSRKESARELGVAPDEELDGHVIPVLIETIKGLSKAADNRFKESGKLTTLILFGFPITALKVMNRSLDYSPIGILRGAMSERESKQFANDPEYKSKYPSYKTDTQKQQRMAEAAVGTAAMIMFLMMVLNEREKEPEDRLFMVHNAGPRDRAARQIWRAAGNEPQSVQFRFSKDSPWLGISWAKAGLEVFTPVFATAGATFDSMDPTIRREDAYDQIMVFFSQTLASMSRPLSSVQDTAGVVSGKEMSLSGRSLANQVGFRASSFLPWSSMARNYNKWQGARDTTNAGSAFAAMIPIVGPSLTEPALNSLGDPVGKTPNEYSYKIGTAIPVSVGLRREDTPLYEFLLNKGKFPTAISRPTQEKKYGQMTNETWRKFVEIRGQTLKSLILQRKESLDKMDSEKYDDMIENLTRIANDRARNQLKLRPAK